MDTDTKPNITMIVRNVMKRYFPEPECTKISNDIIVSHFQPEYRLKLLRQMDTEELDSYLLEWLECWPINEY